MSVLSVTTLGGEPMCADGHEYEPIGEPYGRHYHTSRYEHVPFEVERQWRREEGRKYQRLFCRRCARTLEVLVQDQWWEPTPDPPPVPTPPLPHDGTPRHVGHGVYETGVKSAANESIDHETSARRR